MKTPSFSDIFASFYYTNTYVPPVDFSPQGVSTRLLATDNPEVAAKVQQLISTPGVREILSSPLSSSDLENQVQENIQTLDKHGFKVLYLEPNITTAEELFSCYSLIEHTELPGWVIKAGAPREPENKALLNLFNDRNEIAFVTRDQRLLSIEMINRIAKVAREAHIDVVLPQEKLVAYADSDTVTDITRKYCIVCKKIEVLSENDTVKALISMSADKQRETARNIVTLVRNAGIVDASFLNIRLTPEGRIAIIDAEPAMMMAVKKTDLASRLFGTKTHSVEKCARIGLFSLMHDATVRGRQSLRSLKDLFEALGKGLSSAQNRETLSADLLQFVTPEPGLEIFHEEVKRAYDEAVQPSLSKWKIALSIISLGCIPAINATASLVFKTKMTRLSEKLTSLERAFLLRTQSSQVFWFPLPIFFSPLPEAYRIQLLGEHTKNKVAIYMEALSCLEGIPYPDVAV